MLKITNKEIKAERKEQRKGFVSVSVPEFEKQMLKIYYKL